MTEKRRISSFIPYKIKDGRVLVYLEKRTKDRKVLPDYFGFFGGHAETDENPEQALLREIKEEMRYSPQKYQYFGIYEFERSTKNFYIEEVNDDFENYVALSEESEYGRWFSEEEVLKEEKLIEKDKIVLRDFFDKFS